MGYVPCRAATVVALAAKFGERVGGGRTCCCLFFGGEFLGWWYIIVATAAQVVGMRMIDNLMRGVQLRR